MRKNKSKKLALEIYENSETVHGEHTALCLRNMLLQRQRYSPVGLIGQGLMRITLMMHHSRRVMTELFTKISLVQVGKQNVLTSLIKIVKILSHYTPQTQIVT